MEKKRNEYYEDFSQQLEKLFGDKNTVVNIKIGGFAPDLSLLDKNDFRDKNDIWNSISKIELNLKSLSVFEKRMKEFYSMYDKAYVNNVFENVYGVLYPSAVWRLEVLSKEDEGYVHYFIEPVAIGYKKKLNNISTDLAYNYFMSSYKKILNNDGNVIQANVIDKSVNNFFSIGNRYIHRDRLRNWDWTFQHPTYLYYNPQEKESNYYSFIGIHYIDFYDCTVFYGKTQEDYYGFYDFPELMQEDYDQFKKRGIIIMIIFLFLVFLKPFYDIYSKGSKV